MLRDWWASAAARRHMYEKHAVTMEEVDEVMETEPQIRRGKRRRGEQRYYVTGRTDAGRKLLIVFRVASGVAQVITAWEV